MDLIGDMHMHTLVSGHAYGTIREMAQAAQAKGLEMIGITEHAPGIPGTVDPFYYNNLQAVLKDGTLSLAQSYIDHLDYAIVGIHVQCYENAGKEQNTSNLIACMKNEKVKIVSHPDDDHTPLDYERLVKAAKQYHVALEVNNSSLKKVDQRWNCLENYRTMLSLCQKRRVPVIIDSDAHDPSQVGELNLAKALVESVGFDPSLVLNTNLEKLKSFLF